MQTFINGQKFEWLVTYLLHSLVTYSLFCIVLFVLILLIVIIKLLFTALHLV